MTAAILCSATGLPDDRAESSMLDDAHLVGGKRTRE